MTDLPRHGMTCLSHNPVLHPNKNNVLCWLHSFASSHTQVYSFTPPYNCWRAELPGTPVQPSRAAEETFSIALTGGAKRSRVESAAPRIGSFRSSGEGYRPKGIHRVPLEKSVKYLQFFNGTKTYIEPREHRKCIAERGRPLPQKSSQGSTLGGLSSKPLKV